MNISRLIELSTEVKETPDFVAIEIKYDKNTNTLFGYNLENGHSYSILNLESLAADGNPHAQCAMGDYYSSEGESFDSKKAKYWYEKSANQNHPKAQGFLAGFYISGLGTAKDIDKATYWAEKSAQQNSPTGLSVMCHCCLAKDDYAGAVYWLEQAIKFGYPDSEDMLETVKKLLQQSGESEIKHYENLLYVTNETDDNFDKILSMLQTMSYNYPGAFSNSQKFKALAFDLLSNDNECRGIVRWLDVAIFELKALSLLSSRCESSELFATHQLADRLVKEGAPKGMAKAVTAYLTFVVEFDTVNQNPRETN